MGSEMCIRDSHLRWDSLGEFLALAVSLEDLAIKTDNSKANVLAIALDHATEKLLTEGKSPLRKAGQLDNRGSHFYLAMYWAEALVNQTDDLELITKFKPLFETLSANESKIMAEIDATQGKAVDIGGYYYPNDALLTKAMCPSAILNDILTAS